MVQLVTKEYEMNEKRLQIIITGQVQGVGFRPYVYRVAKKLELTGWVQNNGKGVVIEVQGRKAPIFIGDLTANLPPLAKIETLESQKITYQPTEQEFVIAASQISEGNAKISPDVSICNDCLSELFDPFSRFFYYPFLNCTNCGPRITITRALPYDRSYTTMRQFPLCCDCQNDYQNPLNRRYHAQPTACAQCGPKLSLPIDEIVTQIKQGKILAIKSLGGYQLVCDASNEIAVKNLRARKQRYAKPFAIMALNLQTVRMLSACSKEADELLMSPMRPIVLLPKRQHLLPEVIAPGLSHLGIMLPYTPLHYLLFHGLANYPEDFKRALDNVGYSDI